MQALSGLGLHVQQSPHASPRLERAAHEFEGQLMKELLKPLQGEGEDGEEGGAGGALGDFAAEALGQALSRQGGFGIANRIVKQLSQNGTDSVRERAATEYERSTDEKGPMTKVRPRRADE